MNEETRFVFSDLTVLDKKTGYMWAREGNIAKNEKNWNDKILHLLRQVFLKKDVNITGDYMSWYNAFKFIGNLNKQKYAGYSDWRLPSKEELETLVDIAKEQGYAEKDKKDISEYLNEIGFKNVESNYYWSSTTYARTGAAWAVNMHNGDVVNDDEFDYGGYVWPVRSGQ